ncbi:receptor protein kinase-like protein [Candidatus Thiomargarita nelsonii]|uniref:Receptor protein kinase-like protein n=1 Tax=Candidatus Thiomargarita nelsonii TaxID=1003181 RepID=A0A176S486_9GAMM|nr:receptor protein kinase-like protein [Candidatus Thiomargarita nelsonii]
MTENGGEATITVTRSGDSAISVDYATSDDTASAAPCHNDYTATTGTLNWANGDSANKTFTINLNDDNLFENDETLIIILSNPTGIELGTPDTAVLTITDNDSPSTSFDCTTITGIPSTECSALISLYSYTKGSQWRNNTGWKTTNTPCNWYGVTCENGHVTRLNLQYNRLNGTISWMLESLSQLKVLALNNNEIGGNIPSGIWNLDNLRYINLANNQLRGSIPTEMGHLSQLQSLLLGNNNLHGDIPVSLVNLNNLSGLSLDINHLEAHDPALIPWLNNHNPSWEKTQTPP